MIFLKFNLNLKYFLISIYLHIDSIKYDINVDIIAAHIPTNLINNK